MFYAIPSHRRRNIIEQQTLKTLIENGVDMADVSIFVSDQKDFDEYHGLEERYGLTVVYKRDLSNIVEKFNYIHHWYPRDSEVVLLEDDIEQLCIKDGDNSLAKFLELPILAKNMFALTRKSETKLWGISPYANAFYMKNQTYKGFKFVVANLYGFISTKDSFLEVSQVCKSDYERTLLYFVKYGVVCRMDGVCAITRNYKNSGGLQQLDERSRLESEACYNIVRRFGHLVEINEKKSGISMYKELKLKQIRPGKIVTDYMGLQQKIDEEILRCHLRSKGILGPK